MLELTAVYLDLVVAEMVENMEVVVKNVGSIALDDLPVVNDLLALAVDFALVIVVRSVVSF